MTTKESAPVAVTAGDREAAANFVKSDNCPLGAKMILGYRIAPLAEAFARYRLAALAQPRAAMGEIAKRLDAVKQAAFYAPVGDGAYDPYANVAEAVGAAVDRLAAALALQSPPAAKVDREAVERAIKVTEHPYFGEYQLSGDQWGAVDVLVAAACAILALQPAAQGDAAQKGE